MSLMAVRFLVQVLPAVVNFNPDMIFLSAGFDAHRKDDINHRYHPDEDLPGVQLACGVSG